MGGSLLVRGVALLTVSALVTACGSFDPFNVATSTPPPTALPVPTASPQPPPTPAAATPTPDPTASPKPKKHGHPTTSPAPSSQPTSDPTTPPSQSNSKECRDGAYTLDGIKWDGAFKWYFDALSTPAGMDQNAVLALIKQSFENIVDATNDCGIPDQVGATDTYMGTATSAPCSKTSDYKNVIGFGKMPTHNGDMIGYTCPYTSVTDHNKILEADILLDSTMRWGLSLSSCHGPTAMLEAVVTHELGHAFGLGHVSERQHGDLTMSTRLNGPCDDSQATLGLGDILGLEHLYGSP